MMVTYERDVYGIDEIIHMHCNRNCAAIKLDSSNTSVNYISQIL